MRKLFSAYLLLLLIVLLPANAAPPSCGDGKCIGQETCSGCPTDCGACPTTESSGGGVVLPVIVVPVSPENGGTIRRGTLSVLVTGYQGGSLDSTLKVYAESELFGKVALASRFGNKGYGSYGANVSLGSDIKKGQYAITIKAEGSTNYEERILVTVDPTIYINISLNKKKFSKGERIMLNGNANYFGLEPMKNNPLEIVMSAKDFFLNKTVNSDDEGAFEYDYLISFAEPDGTWNIKIRTLDKDQNEGVADNAVAVSTPEGVAFYTVTFLSPFKDSGFKRGSTIPITVEVKEEGYPLENATVGFRSPTKEILNLNEVSPGTYTTEYKLMRTDLLGTWYLPVQVMKRKGNVTKAGGNTIPITILPASINSVLLSPTKNNFFIGQRIDVKTKLSYDDEAAVEKADAFFRLGNKTIKLNEIEPGTYAASYALTNDDADANSFDIMHTDVYGNRDSMPPVPINVEYVSKAELFFILLYYDVLLRYWYLFLVALIMAGIITRPIWYKAYLRYNLKTAIKNEKRIIQMEKDSQMKYFKNHSISIAGYNKLMLNYKERLSDLKERILKVNSILSKKKWK